MRYERAVQYFYGLQIWPAVTAVHATAYCALTGNAPPVSLPKPMSTVPLATATCAAAQHAHQRPVLSAAG